MALYAEGDILIPNDSIMLKRFGGSGGQNIFNLVRSIDIYESLTNYTVSADIYIAEGVDLINRFPMAGEEEIEITFQTPSREQITYNFLVSKIDAQRANDAGNLNSYVLRCVTKDLLTNSFKRITKRFVNKNYDASVAEVITEDLGTGPLVTLEKTKGKFDYVVNNVRPFQIIDLLCERSVSAENNKSSTFFFYEDNQGYHFTTLEKLIKERKTGIEFVHDTINRSENYAQVINARNIITYDTINQGSAIEKVKSGGMSLEIHEFDIMTGEYHKRQRYVNSSQHKEYEQIDEKSDSDFNSDEFNAFVCGEPAVREMVLKDSTRPEMKHNENIHWKKPFVNKIANYTVRVRVYGDTSIRVGDVVKLHLTELTGADSAKNEKQYYSGEFIITNLKHRLDKRPSGAFEHFMILETKKTNILQAIG